MHTPAALSDRIQVVDSHSGGEPTRVIIAGGPELGHGPLSERREIFRRDYDHFRSAVANEPRGSDALVGALLCPPCDASAAAGVIFFNNVGYLGMCVHATMGVMVTLAHLGRIGPGAHLLETPVGGVIAVLHPDGRVAVRNVPSYRFAAGVRVEVEGYGHVDGDVAWGGNWFFLVDRHQERIELGQVDRLTDVAWRIRQALKRHGIAAAGGAEVDHIELFGPSPSGAHSKNFVLCPGKAYDRSPCGTGTSAKVACLIARGRLQPGEIWQQEGILGSVFEASGQLDGERVIPTITGSAYLTAEATLLLASDDPYRTGIR